MYVIEKSECVFFLHTNYATWLRPTDLLYRPGRLYTSLSPYLLSFATRSMFRHMEPGACGAASPVGGGLAPPSCTCCARRLLSAE